MVRSPCVVLSRGARAFCRAQGMGFEANWSGIESCGTRPAQNMCLKATNIISFAHKSGMWLEPGEGSPSLLGEHQAGAEWSALTSGRWYWANWELGRGDWQPRASFLSRWAWTSSEQSGWAPRVNVARGVAPSGLALEITPHHFCLCGLKLVTGAGPSSRGQELGSISK